MMRQTWIRMILVGIGAGALAAVCVLALSGRKQADREVQDNLATLTVESREESIEAEGTVATDFAESAIGESDGTDATQETQQAETEKQAIETEAPVNLPYQGVQTTEEIYEEMKSYLATFPDDADGLAEQGCCVAARNGIQGEESLDAFWNAYQAGEAAELVIAQYTTEGDPVFDYLKYNGEAIRWVHDSTRDGFAGGEKYLCEEGLYLLTYDRISENGDIVRDFVLTDDADLTYEEYRDVWWGDGLSEAFIRCLVSVQIGNAAEIEMSNTMQAW